MSIEMSAVAQPPSRSTLASVSGNTLSQPPYQRRHTENAASGSSTRLYRVGSLRTAASRRNAKGSARTKRRDGDDSQNGSERSAPDISPGSAAPDIGLGIISPPTLPPPYTVEPIVPEDKTPNFAERIEDRLLHYSSSGNWALEIISWLISALCMISIIGILIGVQNKKMPSWALSFTLNALAKIASAALVLPASEALGQLKWMWFGEGKSKKVMDFEVFDNASRGPWGSVLLLIRTRGRSLAALGALVTLLALALDPFFQQLANYPSRWALQGTSALPKFTTLVRQLGKQYQNGTEIAIPDLELQSVVEKFFFDNGTQPKPFGNETRMSDFPILCPTSNCTWPLFDTLGVCNTCEEVSELLTWDCIHTKIDWYRTSGEIVPNGTMCGYFLNATESDPILMSGYVVEQDTSSMADITGEALIARTMPLVTTVERKQLFNTGSIKFNHIRNPIADFLLVTAPNGPASVYHNDTPVALECLLSWCVKTLKTSYHFASYEEEVVDIVQNTTQGPFPWRTEYVTTPVSGMDTYYNENINIVGRDGTVFGMSNDTFLGVMLIFDEILPSFTTVTDVFAMPSMDIKLGMEQGPFVRTMGFNPWIGPNNVTKHLERLATAMTNVMRSTSSEMVIGSAFNTEVFVSVEWAWISVPLLVLILCGAFLASTIWKSSRDNDPIGVWKNSALGPLFNGLPEEMQKNMRSSQIVNTPRTIARTLRVKMDPKRGWRVSGNWATAGSNRPPSGWI